MNRRWMATGIAIILSIPFLPFLRTAAERLTGTDAPILVPGRGWTLQSQTTRPTAASEGRSTIVLLDTSQSMTAASRRDWIRTRALLTLGVGDSIALTPLYASTARLHDLRLTSPQTIIFDPTSFTTISIPSVTLEQEQAPLVAPVYWLATDDMQIKGTINLYWDDTQLPVSPGRTTDRRSLPTTVNLREPSEILGNDPSGVGLSADYAARFSGWLRIDRQEEYKFSLGADTGARLVLHVTDIIDGQGELHNSGSPSAIVIDNSLASRLSSFPSGEMTVAAGDILVDPSRLDIGFNSDGNGWLNQKNGVFKLPYPSAAQGWGAVFVTVGPPTNPTKPSANHVAVGASPYLQIDAPSAGHLAVCSHLTRPMNHVPGKTPSTPERVPAAPVNLVAVSPAPGRVILHDAGIDRACDPLKTVISGIVLDNGDTPLAGVTVTMLGKGAGQSEAQGQPLTVTITGQFTTFLQGTIQADFGPGISVGYANVQPDSPVSGFAIFALPQSNLVAKEGGSPASATASGSSLTPILTEHVGPGWYALDLAKVASRNGQPIELDFESVTGEHKRFGLVSEANASENVAWIYFSHSGSLSVSANPLKSEPALRAVAYAELINRARDTTFAWVLLTTNLLTDTVYFALCILVICWLRYFASQVIRKLPREIRSKTKREVDLVLALAKWSGVAMYVVCALKDLLLELRVVFVM